MMMVLGLTIKSHLKNKRFTYEMTLVRFTFHILPLNAHFRSS